MEMTSTYQPAWAYRQHEWPQRTGLEWTHTKHGDELRLWLPPGMVGVRIEDQRAVEALAWQEARVGAQLGPAWTTRPGNGPGGTMIFLCDPGVQFDQTIGTGVTVEQSHIPVWPSCTEDGGQWMWYDPDGVPLLGAPPAGELTGLPSQWLVEMMLRRELEPDPHWTADDTLRQFVAETFVPNGDEHRLTTEEIYRTYRAWVEASEIHPNHQVPKLHLARWISESTSFHKWAGRTKVGYRRGFTGLRYPTGSWNQ